MNRRLFVALGLAAMLSARQFRAWTVPLQRFFYQWTRGDALALVLSMLLLFVLILIGERTLRLRFGRASRVYRSAAILLGGVACGSLVGAKSALTLSGPITMLLLFLPAVLVLGGSEVLRGGPGGLRRYLSAAPLQRGPLLVGGVVALGALAWQLQPIAVTTVRHLMGPPSAWHIFVPWAIVAVYVWHLAHPAAGFAIEATRIVGQLFAPLALIIALQAASWRPWGPGPSTGTAPVVESAGAGVPIVILIFDEWGRRHGLPESDTAVGFPGVAAVAAGSVTFPKAHSPGVATFASVPRLLVQGDGELRISSTGAEWIVGDTVRPFREVSTILSRAQAAGYRVEAYGFYLPYPRLFEDDLQHGFSLAYVPRPVGMVTAVRAAVGRSVYFWPFPGARALYHHSEWWGLRSYDGAWYDRQTELEDSAVVAVSRVKGKRLLLVHFPSPHPPFIRGLDGRYVESPSPFNDEAFIAGYRRQVHYTDQVLARLWAGLERRGALDSALVIVTADHGWRGAPDLDPGHPESILEVPLWIRWPGGPRGGTDERAVCAAGLSPLFDLAFEGTAALQEGASKVLSAAVGAPGCHTNPPQYGKADWF